MSFAKFKSYEKKSNFRRTEFFQFSPGQHSFRILSDEAKVFDTHFVHGATILCLGEECPICNNNRSMFKEYGKAATTMPGFIPQRQVGYMNVLDRTTVKICPNSECQEAVKKAGAVWPSTCPKCNASLVSVSASPMNKVKVIGKGKQFFDQIEFLEAAVLDDTETPIGLRNFDLEALVTGKEKTAPTISPRPDRNDKVTVPADALFDLDSAIIRLDPDEMREIVRGVRLSDIFAARRAVAAPATDDTMNASAEIKAGLDSIFEN